MHHSAPHSGMTASNSDGLLRPADGVERRAHRLLKKREGYARRRMRELRKICPELSDDILQRHSLHSVVWALRRASKRDVQTCLPRSDAREGAEPLGENGPLPPSDVQ